MSKHEHTPPPGYLGAPPAAVDPHDHRTSPPAGWKEVDDTREMFIAHRPSFHDGTSATCDLCVASHSLARIDRRCDKHAEPRWHEIATEGLPPTEGDYFTWDGARVEQLALVSADGRAYWTDPFGVDSAMEYEVRNAARITHWQPIVKPAPPTKEPR